MRDKLILVMIHGAEDYDPTPSQIDRGRLSPALPVTRMFMRVQGLGGFVTFTADGKITVAVGSPPDSSEAVEEAVEEAQQQLLLKGAIKPQS